jgi:prevent-host-death family protein
MANKKRVTVMHLLTSTPEPSLTATQFKNACAESLEAVVKAGRPLTVTKHDKPYVQVVPARAHPVDPIGFMEGTVVAAGDLVTADPDAWAASDHDPLAHS